MLKNFLNSIIKKDGFILETSDKKNYIIGKPIKKIPVKFKLKNKSMEYKMLLFPDFYFGKGYTDGDIVIENGTISDESIHATSHLLYVDTFRNFYIHNF